MPPTPGFPIPSTVQFSDVEPGTSATAEGGQRLNVAGAATASITDDASGVFSIAGLETLALVHDPDAPPGSPRVWETTASVQGAGPVEGGPGFGVTIRFNCPIQPTQESFTGTALLSVSQPNGTSTKATIPITASVLPENISVGFDPPGFFVGETKDLTVFVASTYRRDIAGFLSGNATPATAFSFQPLVGGMTVPKLGKSQLTFPVKCPDTTAVGDFTLTFTFNASDPTVSQASDTRSVRVLAHRSVSVTSDLQTDLALLHPSTTTATINITLSGGPATVFLNALAVPGPVSLNLPQAAPINTTGSVTLQITVPSSPASFSNTPAPITVGWSVPADDFHPEEVSGSLTVCNATFPPQWRRVSSGNLGPGTATGSATIFVQQDGLVNFSGHAHDSGLFGENYVFAMAFLDVVDASGKTLAFARTGQLSGTLGGGDTRSDDWNIAGPDDPAQAALIRDNWEAVMSSRVESRMEVTTDPVEVIEVVVAALFAALGLTFVVLVLTGVAKVSCNAAITGGPDSVGVGFICVITFP